MDKYIYDPRSPVKNGEALISNLNVYLHHLLVQTISSLLQYFNIVVLSIEIMVGDQMFASSIWY